MDGTPSRHRWSLDYCQSHGGAVSRTVVAKEMKLQVFVLVSFFSTKIPVLLLLKIMAAETMIYGEDLTQWGGPLDYDDLMKGKERLEESCV